MTDSTTLAGVDRRAFLGLCATLGVGSSLAGALWQEASAQAPPSGGGQQQAGPITLEVIAATELALGLTFTPAEREMMVQDLNAAVRSLVLETPITAALLPMTGVAFLLFTFYMVTDPATTPSETRSQVVFGASVALAYSLLMMLHVVFGLFFALSVVCVVRGILLTARAWAGERAEAPAPAAPIRSTAMERSKP